MNSTSQLAGSSGRFGGSRCGLTISLSSGNTIAGPLVGSVLETPERGGTVRCWRPTASPANGGALPACRHQCPREPPGRIYPAPTIQGVPRRETVQRYNGRGDSPSEG